MYCRANTRVQDIISKAKSRHLGNKQETSQTVNVNAGDDVNTSDTNNDTKDSSSSSSDNSKLFNSTAPAILTTHGRGIHSPTDAVDDDVKVKVIPRNNSNKNSLNSTTSALQQPMQPLNVSRSSAGSNQRRYNNVNKSEDFDSK